MKFNEKIVKLRKLKGLTQDEFAAAVGVSRQAVYKWESGQSYPEVPKLLEMKLLFSISLDDLLDESFEVVLPEKNKKRRISREKKIEIEESIEKEDVVEAEEVAVVAEAAPIVEPTKEELVVEVENEVVSSEDEENLSDKKKVGFFGRIFGRK